jgi:hypothetical protein
LGVICRCRSTVQGIFKNLDFDVALIVDLGIAIVDRPPKYAASAACPYQPPIDFYVLSRDQVRDNAIVNRAGHFIYGFKDPSRSERIRTQHYRGLPGHRNRWDILLEGL